MNHKLWKYHQLYNHVLCLGLHDVIENAHDFFHLCNFLTVWCGAFLHKKRIFELPLEKGEGVHTHAEIDIHGACNLTVI